MAVLKIKLICENCLTLTLDREELARNGLTNEELSPQSRRTRRLLARLLVLAKLETGAAFLGKRMSLQVFAQPEGGALFLLTAAGRQTGEGPAYVFGFADLAPRWAAVPCTSARGHITWCWLHREMLRRCCFCGSTPPCFTRGRCSPAFWQSTGGC